MMGRLFKACLAEGVTASVHDRALLYYRLLRTDVAQAAAVIGGDGSAPPVESFTEDKRTPADEAVWAEFNTLSVVYGKPSEMFIQPDHLIKDVRGGAAAGGGAAATPKPSQGDSDDSLLGGGSDGGASSSSSVADGHAGAGASPAVSGVEEDLLGLSMGGGPSPMMTSAYSAPMTSSAYSAPMAAAAPSPVPQQPPPQPVAAPSAAAAPSSSFLVPGAILAPNDFQAKWGGLGAGQQLALRAARLPSTAEVEALARGGNLLTIASGDVGSHLKFYFYGRDAAGAFHLLEVILDKNNGNITATLKSDNPAMAPAVAQALAAALRPILAA